MENFFNFVPKSENQSLNVQYDSLKSNYEKIFLEAANSIRNEIDKLKPENPCSTCKIRNCKIEKKEIFSKYPTGCAYKEWQSRVISYLTSDYKQKLKTEYNYIVEKKADFHCGRCANCCRLAVSEYSYEQLKQRALRGDKFSKDFISVFTPYKSEEEAKNANPEYFDLLEETMEDQKVYFYYCPKLIGNKCSIYEERPDICKDFPHNPLKLLPSTCSFNEWKNSIAKKAMLLKAKTDIINFYKTKLG